MVRVRTTASRITRMGISMDGWRSLSPTHRDRERERGADTDLALDPDLAAVQLNELPTQGEPQPGALLLRGAGSNLTKLLEDRLLVLQRDADPDVADRDLDRPVHRHRSGRPPV